MARCSAPSDDGFSLRQQLVVLSTTGGLTALKMLFEQNHVLKVLSKIWSVALNFWDKFTKYLEIPEILFCYFVSPGKFSKNPDSLQNLQIPGRILCFSRNSPS